MNCPPLALLVVGLLGACTFEPVYLDFEVALTDLDEVAGLLATPEGFVVAGVHGTADDGGQAQVALYSETGEAEGHFRFDREAPSHARMQGAVTLPGGDVLLLGYSNGVQGWRLGADRALRWQGPLGGGTFQRAVAVDAVGRVAVVGQSQADGTYLLWAAVFEVGAEALTLRGESTWRAPEGSAEGLAVTSTVDGFLVGGGFVAGTGERPVLLALDAEGTLTPTNLHPAASASGRVGALVAVAGGRVIVVGDTGTRASVGVFDPKGQVPWAPVSFCISRAAFNRPVTAAAIGGHVWVAGYATYDARTLWLAEVDPANGPLQARTFGPQPAGGAERASMTVGGAGGLALAATLCGRQREGRCASDAVGENAPHLWHLDPSALQYGEPAETTCR